ncbi:hypothetical protein QFZ71_000303 [Streptomyces sp. V2I9]|nr:hypothetical protein [Streptomyces sp. V2I9]
MSEPHVKWAGDGPSAPDIDVTVPPDRMFPLGDNRANSNDSRFFLDEDAGTVPTAAVLGRALPDRSTLTFLGPTVVLGVLSCVGGGVCAVAGRRRTLPASFLRA